jgi:hypothetical protein
VRERERLKNCKKKDEQKKLRVAKKECKKGEA